MSHPVVRGGRHLGEAVGADLGTGVVAPVCGLPEVRASAPPYLVVPEVLDQAECAAVIDSATRAESRPLRGTVGTEHHVQLAWLDQRVAALLTAANVWGVPIRRASLSVLRRPPGSRQRRHTDVSEPRGLWRRLSTSVLLNAGYEGGALQVVVDGTVHAPEVPAGAALVFPATAVHGVAEVTAGVRWSIVAWAVER